MFNCCHFFYPNSNTVHTHRLQRSHQPVSNRLQKHLDHYQYGVTELLQRVAQEEARGRRWLRCFMMGKYKRCFGHNPVQNGRPPVQPAHWNTSAAAAEKLLWPSSNKLTPSLLSIFQIKSIFIDLIWKIYEELLEDFRGTFC